MYLKYDVGSWAGFSLLRIASGGCIYEGGGCSREHGKRWRISRKPEQLSDSEEGRRSKE